jgi:hypothetical protein
VEGERLATLSCPELGTFRLHSICKETPKLWADKRRYYVKEVAGEEAKGRAVIKLFLPRIGADGELCEDAVSMKEHKDASVEIRDVQEINVLEDAYLTLLGCGL